MTKVTIAGDLQSEKVERQSNIELLRIFAMIGVIILHYISSLGHVLENVIERGKTYSIALVNSLCVCSRFICIHLRLFYVEEYGS